MAEEGEVVVVSDSSSSSDSDIDDEARAAAVVEDFLALEDTPRIKASRGRKRPRARAEVEAEEAKATPPWRGAGQNAFSSLPQHSAMLRLHEEVLEFVSMLRPTVEEEEAANTTLLRVVKVVHSQYPGAEITLFGSRASGMALPDADWDICVHNVPSEPAYLECLGDELRQSGHALEVEVISKARVPIVKYCDAESGIWVDISFNQDSGADSTRFITEAASQWPMLRPLILVLKYYLKQRYLAETYSGGIGSFLLSTMALRALQVLRDQSAQSMAAQAAATPDKSGGAASASGKAHSAGWRKALRKGKEVPGSSTLNLGAALVSFFELFGVKLNYVEVGCSVRGAGAFFRKRSSRLFGKSTRVDGLCMESPVDSALDVGGGAWNTYRYRSAFQVSYGRLKDAVKAYSLSASAPTGSKRRRGADSGPSAPPAGPTSLLAQVLRVDQYLRDRRDMLCAASAVDLYGSELGSLGTAARALAPASFPSFLHPTPEGVMAVAPGVTGAPLRSRAGLGFGGGARVLEMADGEVLHLSDDDSTEDEEEEGDGGSQATELSASPPAATGAGDSGLAPSPTEGGGYDTSEEAAPKQVGGRSVRKARLLHHILIRKHCRPEAKAAAMDMTSWF